MFRADGTYRQRLLHCPKRRPLTRTDAQIFSFIHLCRLTDIRRTSTTSERCLQNIVNGSLQTQSQQDRNYEKGHDNFLYEMNSYQPRLMAVLPAVHKPYTVI